MLKCISCQEIGFWGDEGIPCPRCKSTETVALPKPPPGVITIKFAGPGSTNFSLEIEGHVTPGQLIVAGQMLMDEGRMNGIMPHVLDAVAEAVSQKLKEPQIAVPGVVPMGVGPILKGMRGD